jgi:hypothetical protein
MKNITLLILLLTFSLGFSQTWSTGLINLSTNYDTQIDITATQVTLTLIAPNNIWFGIGFGGSSMNSSDIFRTDGTTIVDASPTDHALPTADTIQDWILDSNTNNTPSSGRRTIVAHRALNTGEVGDYVFSTNDTSISLIWAKGSTTTYAYHAERGITSNGITLGTKDFDLANNYKVYPNPASSILNVTFSNSIKNAEFSIYDSLGKQIYNSDKMSDSKIDISNWNSGLYLIKVSSLEYTKTKKFVKI